MDYDLVHLTSPDTLLIWSSVNYTSLSTFKTATGQELHGIQADPKWASRTANDYHLTAGFDFGDGSATVGPQGGTTATHTYTAAGTYTVTVTVTDTGGLASTATATVQVSAVATDSPPAAALTVVPSSGLVNLVVTADASASTDTDATPIGRRMRRLPQSRSSERRLTLRKRRRTPHPTSAIFSLSRDQGGYSMVEHSGPAPTAGSRVDVVDADGVATPFVVMKVGRSPLPSFGGRCAFLARA